MDNHGNLVALTCLLLAGYLAGCGSGGSNTGTSQTGSAAAQTEASAVMTTEECKVFADQVEASVNACDPSFLRSRFDSKTLADVVTQGLSMSEARRAGLERGLSGQVDFASQICDAVGANGSYRLLHIREKQGALRPLFRMISHGSLNYHELYLRKDASGVLRVFDVFVFMTGETLSKTMRRMVLPMLAEQDKGLLGKLLSHESDYVTHFEKIGQFQEQIVKGEFQKALGLFDRLPESLRTSKSLLLMRMKAAMQVSEKEYAATLEAIQRAFPDDVGVPLLLIDYHFMRQQYKEAGASIERLDREVGGDPYLDVWRARLGLLEKHMKKAKAFAAKALEAKLGVPEPFVVLLQIALEEKAYGEVVTHLNTLRREFGIAYPQMEKDVMFAEFVKTEAYKTWKSQQTKD